MTELGVGLVSAALFAGLALFVMRCTSCGERVETQVVVGHPGKVRFVLVDCDGDANAGCGSGDDELKGFGVPFLRFNGEIALRPCFDDMA